MVPFSNLFLFSLFVFSFLFFGHGLHGPPAESGGPGAWPGAARPGAPGGLVGLAGGLGQRPWHPRAAPRFGAGWAALLGILLASSNNKYC